MEKSYDDIGKADCADMLNLNPSKLDSFIKVKMSGLPTDKFTIWILEKA